MNDTFLFVKVAINQPYFFPYIGYFQLIKEVDLFVLADNFQYPRTGWVNRNRVSIQGKIQNISIPVVKSPIDTPISDMKISSEYRYLSLNETFRRNFKFNFESKHFDEKFSEFSTYSGNNLNQLILISLRSCLDILNIKTQITSLTEMQYQSDLRGEERIIDICKKVGARDYLNLPGGRNLYSSENFLSSEINLNFIEPSFTHYQQSLEVFEPRLSILDLLFTLNLDEITDNHLNNYSRG